MKEIKKLVVQRAKEIKNRYEKLTELIKAPEIIADSVLWHRYSQELIQIESIAKSAKELEDTITLLEEFSNELQQSEDKELKDTAHQEISLLNAKADDLVLRLKNSLITKEDNHTNTAILEVSAVDGKELAMQLCADILEMYSCYIQHKGYKLQKDIYYNNQDNIKYAVIKVKGKNIYNIFKQEEGRHKITLKNNSAFVSVIVTPEDTAEFMINENDIVIEVFHSGGAGGQNVNNVESAVRATHTPTAITAVCQDERSQLKNKQRAIKNLKTKVFEHYLKQKQELKQYTRNQAQKLHKLVRTYDYSKKKVLDKKSGLIEELMFVKKGQIDNFFNAVILKNEVKLSRF